MQIRNMDTVIGFALLAVSLAEGAASAQEPLAPVSPIRRADTAAANPREPSETPPVRIRSSEQLQQLITDIVRNNIPHEYEKRKGWGGTREIFDGVYVKLDGLRLKTHRRKKTVNHGTWKMYRVNLVDPEQTFQIRVSDIDAQSSGRIQFTTEVDANLRVYGRIAEWNRGVQLLSVGANADANVRLRIDCDLGLKLNPLKLPPDVILDPVVTDADVQLTLFRLHNISKLHGPVVRELGGEIQDILEDKLRRDRTKLVEKINRQIDKNRDKLTLSLQDVIQSQWGDLAAQQLGIDEPVKRR